MIFCLIFYLFYVVLDCVVLSLDFETGFVVG